MPSRCACSLSVGSAGDLNLDRLRACDDARLVLFASLNPSKETGTARTNFLRAPPWDAIKPKP
jgi:hypothetical protein